MNAPCHICKGRLGPIKYETSAPNEPLGFVIDEIIPISKYWLGGYESPEEAALDFNNLAPAHRICNQMKGNKINYTMGQTQPKKRKAPKKITLDGDW